MRRLLVFLLFVGACGSSSSSSPSSATDGSVGSSDADPIAIPLSLYVVTSDDDALSSGRTTDDLNAIAVLMNEIWAPARITFDPIEIAQIDVPDDVVAALARGDDRSFLEQAGISFDVPGAGIVNGFYVRDAGGPNGFTPAGSRVFFVDDEPTVHDERVSSHEVGHIFGLHHATDDARRLMFSGTNGMTLTLQEREVARYVAQGILDGVR